MPRCEGCKADVDILIRNFEICEDCIDKLYLYGIRCREVAVLKEAINKVLNTQYIQSSVQGEYIEEILKTALDFCGKT